MACSDPNVAAQKVVVAEPDVRVRTLMKDGTFTNGTFTGKDLLDGADPKAPEMQALRTAHDAYVAAFWSLVATRYQDCT